MRFLIVPIAALILQTPPAQAQQQPCGWSEIAAPGQLPAFVETVVAQLPASWSDASKTIDNLRKWYHTCDGSAAYQAVFDLRRAADRNKQDMAVAALLGLALVHGPEVQVEGATGVTNRAVFHLSNSERDGARLLARASADPRFVNAAIDLADVALATRHEATVKVARDALRLISEKTPLPEQTRLAAELALVAKDYAGAETLAAQAVSLGAPGAMHALGVARILTTGDTSAAHTYLAGLEDPNAIDLYYDDISYLLQGADSTTWQTIDASARGAWIRQQWEWRASTSSLSLAERLKLHFTRLVNAWDLYPRTVFRASGMNNAIVADTRLRRMSVDDRGLIYIRHGAPVEIIHMSSRGLDETRIAWAYNGLADGSAVFEFTKKDCSDPVPPPPPSPTPTGGRQRRSATNSGSGVGPVAMGSTRCSNSGDYYLASPLKCLASAAATEEATYYDYGTAISKYDPGFGATLWQCFSALSQPNSQVGFAMDLTFLQLRRHSITTGTDALRTETAGPNLTAPLATLIRTYALRDAGRTNLYAFAVIDGGGMHPKIGTSDYALRLTLSVENNQKQKSESIDTTLTFKTAAPMTAGQLARTRLATSASPAEDAVVRFTVRNQNDATQGQITTTARAIPDLSTDRFALSDLIVAENRDGNWIRGDAKLAPVPGHYVTRNNTFRLYYEAYGVQTGDSLNVQITIAPGDDADIFAKIKDLVTRKSAVQVTFADRANADASGTARVIREIGADLQPGRYILSVKVTNGRTNQTATSRTDLVVLKQ